MDTFFLSTTLFFSVIKRKKVKKTKIEEIINIGGGSVFATVHPRVKF